MIKPTKTKSLFPVSLLEAKRHLRVDEVWNDDDAYINETIEAATYEAENYIEKDIALTANVLDIYNFYGDKITIDDGNFIDVTNVISDTSTLLTVLNTKEHYSYFTIYLSASISSTTEYVPLKVEYNTGYNDDIPKDMKQSILMKIANFYDTNREDATPGFLKNSNASNKLLDKYKSTFF